MKRFFPIFLTLAFILTLSIAGCGGGNGGGDPSPEVPVLDKSDVIFVSGVSASRGTVVRMHNADDGMDTIVLNDLNNVDLLMPAVSSDRSKLAYLSYSSGCHVMFKDSGSTQELTLANFRFSGEFSMALSPDGTKLAYVDRDAVSHIRVITISGGAIVQLTNCTSGKDKYPTWSPDGTKIAFVNFDAAGNAKIYKVNADGSSTDPYGDELISLNTKVASNEALVHLAWSPTNPNQMACGYRESSTGGYYIYTINLTTKTVDRLTDNSVPGLYPRWSQDGNYIFFENNSNNLYYNSIDKPNLPATQITTDGKSTFYGWPPS